LRFGLTLLLSLLCGCASTPLAHVGPVTGVVIESGEVFACSQAGVQTAETWIHPSFRVTCIDVRGDRLLAGGGDPAESGNVALYSRGGEKIAECAVTDDLVYAVAIHPDGTAATVGCADGSVHVLSLPTLRVIGAKTRHTAPCRVVRYSADGKFLATGGLDGLVYFHDLNAGTTHVIKDHTAGVECLILLGARVYSGARDGKVRVHNRDRLVRTYQGMRQPVLALTTRNDEVLAGLRDGRILRLNPSDATHHPVASVKPPLFSLTASDDRLFVGTMNAYLQR
jgi:WD40 repeat protein